MTNTTTQMEIPLSKMKMTLMLIGSIGFVAVGFWFVIMPPTTSNPFFGNQQVLLVTGIASIIFFGICAMYIARKLTDNKPGLIIDKFGLTDNSSGVSAGQILWSDIESISVVEIHRQKIIMLHVKNPQVFIDKQPNGFKKKMMQLNYKMYGTPLSLAANTLQIKFDELFKLLNDNLNSSR